MLFFTPAVYQRRGFSLVTIFVLLRKCVDIGQLLDLIGDFDVLVALDFFAVHHEANRHCVPELGCEFSAFHVFYLRGIFLPRG